MLELARRHLGLRRTRGLHVRHADGRDWVAVQPAASWDAIVLDAFIGARIPRRLVSPAALRDAARVAPLTLINVVDDRGRHEVGALAASLASAYPHVWSLGGRVGNTILVGGTHTPPLAQVAAAAAADPSPAQLTGPAATRRLIAGAAPPASGDQTPGAT